MTSTGAGSAAGRRVRRGGLGLVMVGALSVSVRGQVVAVEPLLGGMSVVLALTNDLAALLALNELMSTQRRDVRRWAWAVLVLAGGTAAGLNTWHALQAGTLPPLWAVVVGVGPVLLAVVLSHLVALVLSDAHPAGTPPAVLTSTDAAPLVSASSTTATTPAAQVAAPAIESSRAAQVQAEAQSGPGVQHGLAVVAGGRALFVDSALSSAVGTRADEQVDPRVERLTQQLRGGLELTGASVAAQLGCSDRTGRRLLRQAQDQTSATSSGSASSPSRPERGTG